MGEEGDTAKGDYGRKAEEAQNMSCIRAGRKKGACVSLLSTQSPEESYQSTKATPVHANAVKQTLKCQLKPPFFQQYHMHSAYSSANNSPACLSSITTLHVKRMRKNGREEKRGALFKEPGGRNLCGCGRTTPPSFTGFFITEGKQGPHNHRLIITSMKGR